MLNFQSNMSEGLIQSAIGGFYEINSEGRIYVCKAKGAFRHLKISPLPGDKVEFEVQKEGFARIVNILPRKNKLVRPAIANIDLLFITVSASLPEPDFLLCDKLIFACEENSIQPIVVINKADTDENDLISEIRSQYRSFTTIAVSAKTGFGIDELREAMQGNICCFAGQSGVGKSSLMNALLENANAKTGALSQKTEHGRHTTRETHLYFLDGCVLMDTPGFSMYEPDDYRIELLMKAYPEYSQAAPCRFSGCRHINEPDCGVKFLVKNGIVSKERYDRYIILAGEFEQRRKHRFD